ncbi:amidase [Octadecabacter sp. R77987]|uniref:amidase n=1 Tax=Octadecabacter sp. R77987 TaxID=3093874 RepID=UPI003672707F
MDNPADLDIAQAGRALRDGALTSLALTKAHLERIDARNPVIGAFVHVAREDALQAAAAADQMFQAGMDHGPMQGIPFAIKDVIDVAGWPVRWGSRSQETRKATHTAPAVQRLIDLGAVPLGLVATYELATVGPDFTSLYPPPVNPWNPDHITGGSSSGSAAAVAAGMVRVSLGTDTGGSLRSPASYCGVVGFKPTFGAVPMQGVMPLSPSLDHVGPIARTVADAAAAFAVIGGQGGALRDMSGMSLAYGRGWADGPVLSALDAVASALSLCGARISLVDMPDYDAAERAGTDILLAECFATHGAAAKAGKLGDMARASILSGAKVADEAKARAHVAPLRTAIDAILANHDALILPTTIGTAPPFSDFASGVPVWTAMRTLPFNMTGHPALSVPMGFVDGLPLGLQIVGRHGDENTVLAIGAAFEAATDHGVGQPSFI